MKTQEQLINNVIGQLNGINKMISEDKECLSVLVQMKAVKSAVNSLMNRFIEENVLDCFKTCHKGENEEMLKKLLLEITKNN